MVACQDVRAHHRVLAANAHTVDGLHDDEHEEEAIDAGAVGDRQQHSACTTPAIVFHTTADALARKSQLVNKTLAAATVQTHAHCLWMTGCMEGKPAEKCPASISDLQEELALTNEHDAGSHDGTPLAAEPIGNEADAEHAKDDTSNLGVCQRVQEVLAALGMLHPATWICCLEDGCRGHIDVSWI